MVYTPKDIQDIVTYAGEVSFWYGFGLTFLTSSKAWY